MGKRDYYRRITELLPRSFLKGYLLVFLLVTSAVLFLYLLASFSDYSNAHEEWLRTRDNSTYWQEVAIKQGNSPDAYYQAGLYAAELHDNQKAIGFLNRAIELDPGFEKAKKLREQLMGNSK